MKNKFFTRYIRFKRSGTAIMLLGIFFFLSAGALGSPVFPDEAGNGINSEKLAAAGDLNEPAPGAGLGGITLSITPPLIKNNVNPGQEWKSAVKVVNNNSQAIQVYVKVMDFKSGSESGTVEFIDSQTEGGGQNRHCLSGWIIIDPGPYEIGPYESRNISFSVNIPKSAAPGGHYAAILAGTRPPEHKAGGSEIKISSLLGSLLLLNAGGEAIESGRIREFSTDKKFYSRPDVNFTMRFENTGNMHIQPQGEIRIFNFLGKEKGKITINHYSDFGYILPDSIRKWDFNWQDESRFWEMGRYKAVLVLGYGQNARSSADQTINFWIINFKILSLIISIILFLFFIIMISIKAYIKRAIRITQEHSGLAATRPEAKKKNISAVREEKSELDLNNRIINNGLKEKNADKAVDKAKISWLTFSRVLKIIFVLLIILLAVFSYIRYKKDFSLLGGFFHKDSQGGVEIIEVADEENQSIEEAQENNTAATSSAAEESGAAVFDTATTSMENETGSTTPDQAGGGETVKNPVIKILNGSGRAGIAGAAASVLKAAGIKIQSTGNADNFDYKNTLIKYKPDFSNEADRVRELFTIQIEMIQDDTLSEDVVLIMGSDY